MEIWKDIIGYEGLYQVSNYGNVKGVNRYKNNRGKQTLIKEKLLKFLKKYTNYGYYLRVQLYKNGVMRKYAVHRLVANAFISNPHFYDEINHKDEIKSNNNMDNLEWCNRGYNVNYGTGMSRLTQSKYKKVGQYTVDGLLIKIWDNMKSATEEGFVPCNITLCCKGNQKTHKNYIWRYVDNGL